MASSVESLLDWVDENGLADDVILAGRLWADLAELCLDRMDHVQAHAVQVAKKHWRTGDFDSERKSYLHYISLRLDRHLREDEDCSQDALINRIVFASLLGNEGMGSDQLGFLFDLAEAVGMPEAEVKRLVMRHIPGAKIP